jgi:ubiquinol-cytochrome c reductase cytochrome c1 subunit
MNAKLIKALLGACLLLPLGAQAAGGAGDLPDANINVNDTASLQRGAQLFVNYCQSCHSADFMRYKRIGDDLGLSDEAVMENLVFDPNKKIGETMSNSMKPEDAAQWFGKAPPDLSVIGRSRGANWLYAYMTSFYEDEFGQWNNTILPNAAMPHVMWELQGMQKPVYKTVTEGSVETQVVDRLELATPGLQSPEEYEQTVRDLVNFLVYLGEPAQLQRKDIGIWVMVYLALFTFIAYLLKREFWRDVH